MAEAAKKLLHHIGEDPERNGLVRTPDRYARALLFFTKGYSEDIHEVVNDAIFEVDHQNLVLVKDIEIFSMCEHHMVPFMGNVCQYFTYIYSLYVARLTPVRYKLDIFPITTFWVCQNWLALQKYSLAGYKCKSVLHNKWPMRSTKCCSPRVWRWLSNVLICVWWWGEYKRRVRSPPLAAGLDFYKMIKRQEKSLIHYWMWDSEFNKITDYWFVLVLFQ